MESAVRKTGRRICGCDRAGFVCGHFHRKLLERGFAMADETPLQVLHEPERRAQTKSYMWLFRSGEDGGPPIILYKYSETRAGDNAVDFLHGFKGYLMCDGYSGYNKVPDAKRTACWAHIRRYLTDAIPKGKALDYTQPSVQGMLYINQLFHLEDVIRSKYSSFDAINYFSDIVCCTIAPTALLKTKSPFWPRDRAECP